MDEQMGRRERKKATTRRAIKRAALQLALEHGLDNLTVEAISEAADVSPRTFFNYFSSKDEALMPEPPWTAEEIAELVRQRPTDEPIMQTMREVTKQMAITSAQSHDQESLWRELISRYPELWSRIISQVRDPHTQFNVVVDAVAERSGTDPQHSLYPALAVGISAMILRIAAERSFGTANTDSLAQYTAAIDECFDLLERGL